MKKFLSLMLVALFSCYTFAQSEVSDSTQVTKKQSYAFYKNYSHWSLAVSGGFNLLLSERDQVPGQSIQNYTENFLGSFNFEGEYTINPVWGVALDYVYSPFSKKAIFANDFGGVHPEKNGQGHQVYAVVNMNLLNLFSRYRTRTDWNWYFGLGIGMFAYNSCLEMITENKTDTWSVIPMFPFESQVSYAPIKDLSIFLKATLAMYLRDNVNVCAAGPLNDWQLYTGVGLRWNINASKKPHVRNTDMATYQYIASDNNGNGTDTAAQNKIKRLEKQLNDLQNQLNNNAKCCNEVQQVKKHADDNTDEINRLRAKLDSIKRTNKIANDIAVSSVYFANNSAVITDKYQPVVEKVARLMMADPSLELEITAFCSKNGNVEKNKIVGGWRIDAVKDLLVNKYKIDEKRIRANYNGQVFDGLESENRRCDLKLE